jgi:4-amino-4-deoxy-L-arabinose transferase-like glycosyltransferase
MPELDTLAKLGALVRAGGSAEGRSSLASGTRSPRASADPRVLLLRGAMAAAAVGLFIASVLAAARGLLPGWLGGASITASYVAAVVAVFHAAQGLGAWTRDEAEIVPSLLKRHGFWLVGIAGLLYLPTLGLSSLWDPWETHYGEVAREILVRRDWISLWWAHDGFFYSKPVLIFWMEAITMAVTGVHVAPGHVLDGGAHPEWAVRMPNALLAILGLYLLYWGAAKAFGRRAALLGGLVLATSPFWFLLAHQATADMAFVAPMAAAMGLLLRGLYTGEEEKARVHEVRFGARAFGVSGWHLCIGAIVAVALPQIVYLATRNVDLVLSGSGPHGFRFHLDSFQAGSGGGNCGQPGNAPCATEMPAFHLEPIVQGAVWLAGLGALLRLQWNERRTRRLLLLGAWFFAAIATLAKGPAGFGLPVLCALAYVAATGRWRVLLDAEIVSGLLVIVVVALPWYIAVYVRHGSAFTDELIFHDMFNRAFSHVHDTNEGEETSFRYYVAELGYGLFPWVGLAPLGLVAWMRRIDDDDAEGARRRDGAMLLFGWFLLSFVLFTMMGTKFHHYILPAVPPVAMLIGLGLDEGIGRRKPSDDEQAAHHARLYGAATAGGALLLALVSRDLVTQTPGVHDGAIHFAQLFSYQYHRPWPSMLDFATVLTVFGGLGVALMLAATARGLRRGATAGAFALAAAFAVWGSDVYLAKTGRHWGQGDVIRAYYASRAGESEPLVAYQMNWKGENFYTGNRMPAFKSTGAPFTDWMRGQRERGTKVVYFVVEHSRVGGLKSEAQAKQWQQVTTRDDSHQFVLMRAEL